MFKGQLGGLMKQAQEVQEKLKKNIDPDDVIYLTETNIKKTPEGRCLDELGLTKICCRRHMLTHVDIE